jgi:hypothetical protein
VWSFFEIRASSALAIAVVMDTLDYVAPMSMLFATPLLGVIFDGIVTGILYIITRSKRSTLINLLELIPVIGDLVPAYTISTVLWVYTESKKEKQSIIS